MSAKSSIQVCIKVRPCEPELPNLWHVKDKRTIHPIDSQADPCVYDYVFDQGSNNQEVFDGMAKHIVEACVKGFNGTIFAYGQTSSGKTYTMIGDRENPGVMILAAKEIFNQISNNSDRDFLLRVGYIEIYNEKIYDLLNKKNQDLKIFESNGMVNVNCEECIITTEEDLLQFLCMGNKERTVGETNMNERSSRSHAIFRIIIESRKTDRTEDDAVIQSILNLVDLAGSERADQTGARGTRLKEGSHINKSLLFLSNVIKNLAENEDNRFVNYRDSKLTRILQASLGGNAFTSIICTIRPSNMEESQSTLNFAMRAKKIRLKPQLNEIVSDATMMKRLEREIKVLKDRLAEEQARNESQLKVRLLEQRIKTDTLKIITSNTITDHRNKIRRRTWCPASSNPETTVKIEAPFVDKTESNGPTVNVNFSHLPKPCFYPKTLNPNQRALNGPTTINIMKSLEIKEEFNSLVEPNFEPTVNPTPAAAPGPRMRLITLTPTIAQMGAKGREMLEREVVELEAFTKIEQHINSEWEVLNENLSVANAKIDELQAERLNLLQRSEALQVDVDALRKSKEEADAKIVDYEEQLKKLKQTVDRLDMENRAAVELEFQFSSHKTKSKLRENELLTALSEKDSAIDNLQKSLNELSNEVLRNSKDDHMRSICPALETSCEIICKKCVELERLLEEHNNKPNADNGGLAIDCECEQLRLDIAETRAQLESVQSEYKQMSSDVAEKSELCDRLSRDVISAEEAKEELQVKFDDLEQTKLRHEQIIKNMQEEYNAIKQKYQALQRDYETLERAAAATEEQHKKLQSENERLQQEISTLKQTVEEIQLKLIEAAATEIHEALVQQLKASNEQLMANLAQMETKYGELQGEYDDLSNQLMESVQEGDSLRDECNALQEKLKTAPMDTYIAQLEQEVAEMREAMTNLQSELLEKSVIANKVEDYKSQIESLEKQHAEMTMVCEELQEKVKETTINESLSRSTSTLIAADTDQEEEEVDKLKLRLNQMNGEVQKLQIEIKNQLSIIQQKDVRIEEMQFEVQELSERCLSMDVLQVELRSNAQQQNELLDRQTAKLADDVSRIDQLQESNAKLTERCIKAEEALEERLKLVDSNKEEYEKRLNNLQLSLNNARKEFEQQEKMHKGELNNINLEFLQKIEVSESRYRENLHKYNTEWQDRLQKISAEADSANDANTLAMDQLNREKHELESLYNESQKLVEQLQHKLSSSVKDKNDAESCSEKLQELHEKCKKQLQDNEQLKLNLDNLQQEKTSLQSVVDDNKLIIERLNQELHSEKNLRQCDSNKLLTLSLELKEAIQSNATAKTEYNEQIEACNLKVNDLQEELNKAKQFAKDVDKLSADYEQIQGALAKANEFNKFLAQRAEDLEREFSLSQTEVNTQKARLDSLQSKLDNTLEVKNSVSSMEATLTQKLQQLENEMSEQTHQFQRQIEELESSKAELNFKMESLQQRKLELETSNHELTVKLKNDLNMQNLLEKEREQIVNLQQSNAQLLSQLQTKQTACDSMQQSLQQAELQLKSKQDECQILQQTIQQSESLLGNRQSAFEAVQQSLQQAESELKAKHAEFDKLQESLEQAELQLQAKQSECEALQQSLQQTKSELEIKNDINNTLQQIESRLEMKIAAYDALQQSMQQAELQLQAKQEECHILRQTLQQSESQLELKQTAYETLQQTLQQAEFQIKTKQDECDALQQSLQQIESELKARQKEYDAMQQSESRLELKQAAYDTLQQSLQHGELQLKAKESECEALQQSLQQAELQLKTKLEECQILQQSLQQSESQLEIKKAAYDTLQQSLQQAESQLKALQQIEPQLELKKATCDTLQQSLQQADVQLKAKQKECHTLQKSLQQAESQLQIKQMQCDALQKSSQQLEAQQVQGATELSNKNAELVNRVKMLQTEMDKLRSMLKANKVSFDADRARLDATISSLLEDKRNLEEKLCLTNDIVQKLETDLKNKTNNSNLSFDSNTSNTSPAARRSLDRDAPQPRKSLSLESEVRRNRRITTHDERRQSYWNDSRHVACMTDPVDTNCNCEELDRKLKECQFELFIRESKVTALNIELKNHPLKEENAQLKKRLQEEQQKARDELKRMKNKHSDLMSKLNALTASASISSNVQNATFVPPVLVTIETQTESELELDLQKTTAKLNDAVQICRHRYNYIKELEDRLKQKENSDTSNISSQTTGEIILLKSKLDTQKKEIAALTNKYELAKKALKMRKDEIVQLRQNAGTDTAATSK
ncbi:kinesin-like protein KIN-7I isoform X1 [Drosophila innubila]|uniref:kinesin-like protein KIN-7I isoform X1 n=2 Tax=Drosophila innubila TaxID=198719 RepID=UPI00148E5250|nr:kinesin-like protein KIN-7I isoform X1 [Drosophila innubila]